MVNAGKIQCFGRAIAIALRRGIPLFLISQASLVPSSIATTQTKAFSRQEDTTVIPAQAGIQANHFGFDQNNLFQRSPKLYRPKQSHFNQLAQKLESASAQGICPAQLPAAIEAIFRTPNWQRSRWGILIQTQAAVPGESSQTLYANAAKEYFIPASTAKLFVAAAALQHLGPNFRFRTSALVEAGSPTNSQDLVLRIRGRGDPSLTNTQLDRLAQTLYQKGIRHIQRLLVEQDYFRTPATPSTWEWGDLLFSYAPPINSLILNQNAVQLTLKPQASGQSLQIRWADPLAANQWQIDNQTQTTQSSSSRWLQIASQPGSPILRLTGQLPSNAVPISRTLTLRDPDTYFLQHLQQALAQAQISVEEASLVSQTLSINRLKEIAWIESLPLSQLLKEVNQSSNNLYAEAILRSLGTDSDNGSARISQAGRQPSALNQGLKTLEVTLSTLSVDSQSYQLVDGSGLSRHNRVSPEALVQVLQGIARSPYAEKFRGSLAVSGETGTLKNRFLNTDAEGIILGKTGTMSHTVSLAGYAEPPNYQPLVFSIIVNQSEQSIAETRQTIDTIVQVLALLKTCNDSL